ncbi:MAG: DoxX family protein [Solirubrobacteraceae bacterium]
MTALQIAGRVLFALVFVVSPGGVLRQARMVAGAPPLRWIPRNVVLPLIVGASLVAVAGALLVAFGIWPDLGALLLLAFLVPVTLTMHRFWEITEPGPRAIKRGSFLLNVGLAGGAILAFCLFNEMQDVPGGLTDPLFGRW